jgi:hypothetical protein
MTSQKVEKAGLPDVASCNQLMNGRGGVGIKQLTAPQVQTRHDAAKQLISVVGLVLP